MRYPFEDQIISTEQVSTFSGEYLDQKLITPHWFALYTRSRHEKFVNGELNKKGVETFLPLRKVMRNWSDRRKIIEEPLFQGYLFVHIPLAARLTVMTTVGAVCLLGKTRTEPSMIPETELLGIRRFIDEEIQVDPYPYLKEGKRIRVRHGPFRGVEGFIVRKDNHCRLVVSLNLIMQSVSIQIDEASVELV